MRLCGGDIYTADDLTQETFFQAYRGIRRFSGNCRVETWLCSIAHNVFCAFLRKEKKQRHLAKAQAIDEDAGDCAREEPRLAYDVAAVLPQLPSPAADVLSYRLFQEMPYAEIAGLLGISENSAKVIYHRARAKLRKILEEAYGYEV